VKYRTVHAGPHHVCAVTQDGQATCRGGQGACALPPPPEGASFRGLSVGTCHVCGRDQNNGVRCWGPEGTQATSAPEGLVTKDLASGDGFSCAVDEKKKSLACWGTAPAIPADLPAELEGVGARGGTVCALAKGGALRCWGAFTTSQAGPFTSIAVASESVCAAAARDRIDCFAKSGVVTVPEDPNMLAALDPGRTSEEIAASKKRRADTFLEMLAKMPEREAPIQLDRNSKIPVGRVVEDGYLHILEMVNPYQVFPTSNYHHGFSLKAAGKKVRLIVVHEGAIPKLMSFGADGRRIATLPLVSYAMNSPDPALMDCGDVREEVVMESTIEADLKITQKTTTILESLGRLKNQEGKIQNYCKIRQTTDVYSASSLGAIDKVSTKSETVLDKIADEACRGKWFKDPRGTSYKASDNMPDECVRRLPPR
jgi:hypothetical protein